MIEPCILFDDWFIEGLWREVTSSLEDEVGDVVAEKGE